jgi:hypothetical protein
MIKIHCHTNLDLHPSEKWPTELPCRPMVGDIIQSSIERRNGVKLELQVVRITFTSRNDEIVVDTELHLQPTRFPTIFDFDKWYHRIVYGN